MKKSVVRSLVATSAILAGVAVAPSAAFAAPGSTFCRGGTTCRLTVSHPSRGTVSVDVSSTRSSITHNVPWDLGHPAVLCTGTVKDDGVVRSFTCPNVPAGNITLEVTSGGNLIQLGIRF